MKQKLQEQRGSVLVLVSLLMVALTTVTALAVDIGNVRQTQRNLQSAADAGALAGTQRLEQASGGVSPTTYAADYALDSLDQPRTSPSCSGAPAGEQPAGSACYPFANHGFVYVTTPWSEDDQPTGTCGGSCPTADHEVNVKVCQSVNATLARVINITAIRPCQSATAAIFGGQPAPMALFANSSCGHGIVFNTSGATIPQVIVTSGDFDMEGSNNTLGPTYYGSGCTYTAGGTADTYGGASSPTQQAAIADPCTVTPYPAQCNSSVFPSACTRTSLPAGTPVSGNVYCITSGSNSNVDVSGFTGTATFVMSGGGGVNFKCNTTCNVSPAPGGGGFLVYVVPPPGTTCGSPGSTTNKVVDENGSGSITLSGTIWAPAGKVNLISGTTLNGFVDSCTMNVNGTIIGNGPVTQIPNTSTPALVR
jgi:Flp pilus assembly protein TadG